MKKAGIPSMSRGGDKGSQRKGAARVSAANRRRPRVDGLRLALLHRTGRRVSAEPLGGWPRRVRGCGRAQRFRRPPSPRPAARVSVSVRVWCKCVCVRVCVCAGGDSVRLPPFLSLSVLACPVLLRLLARSPSLHPPPLSSSLPFPPLPFPSLLVADPVCAPAPSTRHGEHSRPCAHQAISAASGRRNEPAARAQTCVSTQQPAQRCQPAQPSQLAVACCRRPSPPPPLHCRLQWTSGRHARRTLRVCTAIGLSWSRLPAPSAAAFRTPASPAASVLLRGPVGSDFDLARTSPSRAAAAVDDDSYLSHPLAFRHLRIPTADRLDAAAPATVSASPLNDSSADISQQPRLWTTYSLSHVPERTHPTNHSPT